MKDLSLDLLHFRFSGGDKSEYRINGLQDHLCPTWQNIVQRIGRTRFPTTPPSGADIDDMVFVNCPGFPLGDGMRIHCVYFRIRGARAFRNVFCFAYRDSECPLSVLAGVSAEEWWDACRTLSEQSTSITLPCHTPPHDLPELRDTTQGCLLYHFPDKRGYSVTKEITSDEFDRLLSPPRRPTPEPPPSREESPRHPQKKFLILASLFLGLCIVLIGYVRINKPPEPPVPQEYVILGTKPYGTHCPVCMGAKRIVRIIRCPQCGGGNGDCSLCHGSGKVETEPVVCPSCPLNEDPRMMLVPPNEQSSVPGKNTVQESERENVKKRRNVLSESQYNHDYKKLSIDSTIFLSD